MPYHKPKTIKEDLIRMYRAIVKDPMARPKEKLEAGIRLEKIMGLEPTESEKRWTHKPDFSEKLPNVNDGLSRLIEISRTQ
jgi:hypothetical protein